MTIGELRNKGNRLLEEAGINDAAIDAVLLLEYVLSCGRDHILACSTEPVEDKKEAEYLELLNRRREHVPLQYLTGHQEFMGLDFEVNEDVLVPRQDTECLVEEAMIETEDGMRVLDLCTGSGCIIISLAKYKNNLDAVGIDISDKAVMTAVGNAKKNGVKVRFLTGDLYDSLHNLRNGQDEVPPVFDVIVSNPPYIKSGVIDTLMEEVKDHEPILALDGGSDGLDFYRRIISGAETHLVPGGVILFEIGCDQGAEVTLLLEEYGYRDIQVIRDLAGLNRVVKAHRPVDINSKHINPSL